MPKRIKWEPKVVLQFEETNEFRFAKTLVELGELIYKEIRSRQLHQEITSSIATESVASQNGKDGCR